MLPIGPAGGGKSNPARGDRGTGVRAGPLGCSTEPHRMLSQLRATRADLPLEQRSLRFTAPDMLVLDRLDLRPREGNERPGSDEP